MKFIKILLYIIVGLAVLIGILTLAAPTKGSVERSTLIHAPSAVVFNNIASQRNLHKWYPWDRKDPNIKLTYEGTEGAVGETSKWQSEVVGYGEQSITGIDPGKSVNTHIHFIKPFNAEADANIMLTDTAGDTKVTWQYTGNMPRPWNIMLLFMNMDKAVGKDFEDGLGFLKEISEKDAMSANKMYRGYKLSEADMPAKVYVGKRAIVDFKDMGKFFGDNMPKLDAAVQKAKLEPAGPPSGIYFSYDTVKMKSDMAVAFPVKEVKAPLGGWETINAPAGKAVEIDYFGAYSKMQSAYMAIDDYMNEKGLKSNSFVVEEYMTDPMAEKDTAKWLTKIYYYVK